MSRLQIGSSANVDAYAITPGADRSVSIDIEPIGEASRVRRDLNGVLRFVGRAVSRKFRVTVTGRGRRAPQISDLWPGEEIRITLPEPLFFNSPPGADREIVEKVGVRADRSQESFTGDVPPGVVVIGYRLRLRCMCISASVSFDENSKEYRWKIEAEEIGS